MPLDLSALKPTAAPDADAGDEASESTPLLDALEQMRELCDRIEAEQMAGRKSAPPAPAAAPGPDEVP